MTHRTNFGAIISITMVIIATVLCAGEITSYINPPIREQLVSVSDLHGTLNELVISFNFTISVPCVLLHLDSFDMLGSTDDHSTKSLFKTRVDQNGKPIPLTAVAPQCGDCYGAASKDHQCCNSCEDIVNAYQAVGWKIGELSHWDQCRAEGILLNGSERCNAYGSLRVNAIEGGFHLAPGINVLNQYGHAHDYSPIEDTLDLSHEIDHLTFGAPIRQSPLDSTRVIQRAPGKVHYRYNLKAVPTVIESKSGKVKRGFQFTVNYAEIPVNQRGRFGPGIFFVYNFAPVAVLSSPDRVSFIILLGRIVSVIGGAFMLGRLIDSFGFRLNTLEGKQRIGKAE